MLFHFLNHLRSHTTSSMLRKNTEKNTIAFLILNSNFVIIEKESPNGLPINIITYNTIC